VFLGLVQGFVCLSVASVMCFQSGLVFSEAEWTAEWENILRLASPSPRNGPQDSSHTNVNSCCDSPLTHRQAVNFLYQWIDPNQVFLCIISATKCQIYFKLFV
jgi:hypothetical protein